MTIERVSENKIRVTINLDDLNDKNIDFHSFMSNSIESQKLFLDMLDEAKNKVGFVTDDYKILIETAATDNGNFICNLTRIVPDCKKERFTKPNVHIKKNKDLVDSGVTIYAFNCFDDFVAFCEFIVNNFSGNIKIFSGNSKLFLYNYNYYLVMNNVSADFDLLESFCACISEFAYFVSNSNCFEHKLMEFGNLIIDNDAIFTVSSYFVIK